MTGSSVVCGLGGPSEPPDYWAIKTAKPETDAVDVVFRAIQCHYRAKVPRTDSAPILCTIFPLRWEVEYRIRLAHTWTPLCYFSSSTRGSAVGPLFTPLRTSWSLSNNVLHQEGLWSTMVEEIKSYVQAGVMFARAKSSKQPTPGELQPLPVLWRPWLHIMLDFITSLLSFLPPLQKKVKMQKVLYGTAATLNDNIYMAEFAM